jgi:hypothetical protein
MKRGVVPKNAVYWILQSILQDAGKLEFGKCLFQTATKEGEIETYYLAFCKCVVEMTVFCVKKMTNITHSKNFSTFSNLST